MKIRPLLAAGVLLLAVVILCALSRTGDWLMSEQEILAYYQETYGQEMKILSRKVEEFQEGDTYTRSQTVTLCPADLPALEFEFFQWAGYAYSPGPIPQLFPSFSESVSDRYPSSALIYALKEFTAAHGLGTMEESDHDWTVTLAADWEDAVRQIVEYSNSLRDVSPYSHIETVFLLAFRRALDGSQEATFKANLLSDKRLNADAEEIIQNIRIAGNRARAAVQFSGELQAFLAGSGLSYRTETGYNEWVYCQSLTVSIDVGSLTELDAVLAQLAAFLEPLREQDIYTAEGLNRVPITVHFIQRGVAEPKGQIGTWDPFTAGSLSIDTEAIRKHIAKLDLLPEEAVPFDGGTSGTDAQSPSDRPAAGAQTPSDRV